MSARVGDIDLGTHLAIHLDAAIFNIILYGRPRHIDDMSAVLVSTATSGSASGNVVRVSVPTIMLSLAS